MQYFIQQIANITNGQFYQRTADKLIAHLVTDSRRIIFPEQSLFFALKGMRQDGHDYIQEAYSKGVRNFIISKSIPLHDFAEANFLKVADVRKALQLLATHHRSRFKLPIIGVTGSNGKTTVKEWLYQLLQEEFNIVRSPKSYNSQLGVPIAVWQIETRHTLGIFEAGISEKGEMQRLAAIIQPTIGILTNIGAAHSEGFNSKFQKLEEKLVLFQAAHLLIYCIDDPLIQASASKIELANHFTWSTSQPATLQITNIHSDTSNNTTTITGQFEALERQIQLPFTDAASIENAIHCWCVLLYFGIIDEVIARRMQRLERLAMRLESRAGVNGCIIINDGYNADLTALTIALNFLEQQTHQKKRTLILSDILQSGLEEQQLYAQVAKMAEEKAIQKVIGIGEKVRTLAQFLPTNIQQFYFLTTTDFLQQTQNRSFQSEAILIKGARVFQFERIADRLAEKVHRTVLEVNLRAIQHNLNVFSQYIQPSTKVMVMVKAAAYGSGSVEVARILEYQNVDYLAVAYADEGVELRQAGIQLPIMVLNPEERTLDIAFRYRLEPEIYSLRLLRQLIQYIPDGEQMCIHLKLETGMNRLGFEPEELPALTALLATESKIKVVSMFSHLAVSENKAEDAFTVGQIAQFQQMYETIVAGISYTPIRHILNTSGIVRFPQYQFEMVRLGIGLYGIASGDLLPDDLQVVNTLKARISQIRTVQPTETIGYGRKGTINRPSKIATVSVGYADGLLRLAGNQQYHLNIRGQLAPIIGNVCMDMCMVDVSAIKEVQEGDEVIIFGVHPTVEALATACQTIPYEIFTHISSRVKRVYFEE